MAKRFVSCAVIICMLGALASCGVQEPPGDELSVVTTIFAPYDFARAVAGDLVQVTMLLPPAGESHSFEPTPQDIVRIRNCGVFVYVGGESDAWVERILSAMDTSKIQVVTLMDCVEVVDEELKEGMEGEDDTEPDEHVWTSPKNAGLITRKIADAMCAADPENAAAYQANTAKYLAELETLDGEFRKLVEGAVRKTIAFGDRFPFRYFTDAYGLDYCAAFPGCSTETEASVNTVLFLIGKIRAEGIPVVFHAELSNENMARAIGRATGARVLQLHACHNISRADYEAGKTYLDLMAENLEALRQALA